jgi:ribosomal protein S18 acetylase RimI-like enzyme
MADDVRAWLAQPHEAQAVAGLLVGFRDWYGRSDPPADTFRAGVERLIVREDTEYVLAAGGGEGADPGGVCQLRFRYGVWMAKEDCWLEDLFVREQDRRAGLGEALIEKAIERARERGCGRIELDVAESNRAAWALYERMGFSPGYKPPAPNVLMGLYL